MERSLLRRIPGLGADAILYDLTMRQHLKPHRSVVGALSDASLRLGFCVSAAGRALEWLQIDPVTSIGRLRRAQLTQLAQSIHRYGQRADLAVSGPGTLAGLCFVPPGLDDGARQPVG